MPSASATRIDAWIARAGSVDKAHRGAVGDASASTPTDTLESLEQEFFAQSLIPAAEWPALIEILECRLEANDKKHIATLEAARDRRRAASASTTISRYSAPPSSSRARISSPRKSATAIPTGWRGCIAEQDRVCALLERERAVHARERTRALVTIAGRRDRALRAARRTAARCSTTTT